MHVRNERVVHLSSLMETVEDELRNAGGSAYPDASAVDWESMNMMEEALSSGEDKDYSPETWEEQLTLLSANGLVQKMKAFGVNETTIAGVTKALAENGNPWIAMSL